jgi:hypothetical protein
MPVPRHRKIGPPAGMGRQYGELRTRPVIPSIGRDLCDRYRQEREKQRNHPPHFRILPGLFILLPAHIDISTQLESPKRFICEPERKQRNTLARIEVTFR